MTKVLFQSDITFRRKFSLRFAVLHMGRSAHVIAQRVMTINVLLFISLVLESNCDYHIV